MKILGIDPGLATIGLGLVEADGPQRVQALDWLTIETIKGLSLPDRLKEIREDLSAFLAEEQPELIVVEKLFFSVNEKTAIDVAQARGVILASAAETGATILETTPVELKATVTGDGNADKRQVQDMLVHVFKLSEIPRPDDAADALALALFGAIHGAPIPL